MYWGHLLYVFISQVNKYNLYSLMCQSAILFLSVACWFVWMHWGWVVDTYSLVNRVIEGLEPGGGSWNFCFFKCIMHSGAAVIIIGFNIYLKFPTCTYIISKFFLTCSLVGSFSVLNPHSESLLDDDALFTLSFCFAPIRWWWPQLETLLHSVHLISCWEPATSTLQGHFFVQLWLNLVLNLAAPALANFLITLELEGPASFELPFFFS